MKRAKIKTLVLKWTWKAKTVIRPFTFNIKWEKLNATVSTDLLLDYIQQSRVSVRREIKIHLYTFSLLIQCIFAKFFILNDQNTCWPNISQILTLRAVFFQTKTNSNLMVQPKSSFHVHFHTRDPWSDFLVHWKRKIVSSTFNHKKAISLSVSIRVDELVIENRKKCMPF